MLWCARLNLVVSNHAVSHQAGQAYFVDTFLDPQEQARLNAYGRGQGDRHAIVFRGQLLEMMRWVVLYCEDLPGDGHTFNDPVVRRTFARALLMASEIWSRRVQEPYFVSGEPVEDGRRRVLGSSRKTIEGTAKAPELFQPLGRGWLLFNTYLPQHYPGFFNEFEGVTGITLEEYFVALAALIAPFNDIVAALRQPDNVLFNPQQSFGLAPALLEPLERLLALEAQTAQMLRDTLWTEVNPESLADDQNAPPFNYLPFRKRPVFHTTDGRAVILDSVFMSERLTAAPLFYILGRPSVNSGEVFDKYGKAFEAYICDGLKGMFPTGESLATRLTCNVMDRNAPGGEGELYDACLNDGPEVVLFEITAKLLREDAVLHRDYTTFQEHLQEKYVPKLRQLASGITDVVLGNYDGMFTLAEYVYPVLIVQDNLLSAPIVGEFFNQAFITYLEPDAVQTSGELIKSGLKVAPVILITVSDFEALETSVASLGFKNLLRDYTRSDPQRRRSFRNFLALSHYNGQLRSSLRLERANKVVGDKLVARIPASVREMLEKARSSSKQNK